MTATHVSHWYGPYVSPSLYSMDDGRIVVARCLRCGEWWRAPGNTLHHLHHLPVERDGETLHAFAARHDEATHGKVRHR